MTKTIATLLTAPLLATPLLVLGTLPAATAQDTPEQARQALRDGLYVITGQGGNILFSTGEDGTFVVDDQFERVAEENLTLIREVAPGPVVFVLNTHYHGDHTGGNAAFYDAGATIVATERVRERLANQDTDEAGAEEPSRQKALPVITFSDAVTFHWNGEPIRAVSLRDAHTDGDAMVLFGEADVLHTGDVFFSGRYPYIDVEGGGSAAGMIAALELILETAGPDTLVVPGHGPVGDEAAVRDALQMLRSAHAAVGALVEQGLSEDEVVERNPLAEHDEAYSWSFIGTEKMTRQLVRSIEANPAREAASAQGGAADADAADQDSLAERLDAAERDGEEEAARLRPDGD